MKTVFFTIISDSHYRGCRTPEFIESFKHFHPDIPLVVFGQFDIDREFEEHPDLNFYNCKAHFAKILYNNFDLVVNIDADHLILGPLTSILEADYDVACPANYNLMANASIGVSKGVLVSETQFFQGGLIASTSKRFWDQYHTASVKHSDKFTHYENDVLNMILALSDYKVKYLDGSGDFRSKEFHSYYGCASLGQEANIIVESFSTDTGLGYKLTLNGKDVKAYHFSWGGLNKRHPDEIFSKDVVDFIYSQVVKNRLPKPVLLKQVNGNVIDLAVSEKFMQHYEKNSSYSRYIIENEINPGKWYDDLLNKLPADAVIVDAGANVGLFSAYLNVSPKRKFYCIEPTPIHCEIATDLFSRIKCDAKTFECVLYNQDGEVPLFEEESNSTMNRVGLAGRKVPSLTLQTFLSNLQLTKVHLLKLDIEGAEQQVIMEDPTIEEALLKCRIVFIETHAEFGTGVNENAIIEKMKSFGFTHKVGKREMSHYFVNHLYPIL